ncbi:hypothetical protein RHECNPAF_3340082 [Rhizobium etli CNPAF512]|nr:hypothetical protein RHECNPAF_3340082 [Rhizobium etli CNPAF512]
MSNARGLLSSSIPLAATRLTRVCQKRQIKKRDALGL